MRAVLLAGACALAVYGCDRRPESAATAPAAKPVAAAPIADTAADAHPDAPPAEAVADAGSPDASGTGSPPTVNGAVTAVAADLAPAPFDALAAIRTSRPLSARLARLNVLLTNAYDRDVTGEVRSDQASAMHALRRCGDQACVQAWFGRREAALSKWQE